MGEAKRRKAEIETLKRLGQKIDPTSTDPEPTAAMARRLHSMFEAAKKDGNIDPPGSLALEIGRNNQGLWAASYRLQEGMLALLLHLGKCDSARVAFHRQNNQEQGRTGH